MDVIRCSTSVDSNDRLYACRLSKSCKEHGTTTRRLVKQTEHWTHAPPSFVHTNIIYEEDGRFFIACVRDRFGPTNPISIDKIAELRGREIYVDLIWPAYDCALATAVGDNQNLFLKTPNFSDVALEEPQVIKRRILMEARLCEEIRKSPHPNVVDYRGCLVENCMIKGLWLKRYGETLYDRVKHRHDSDKILVDVTRGIDHLHSIGISHEDLQPANILFDDNDNAVVVDLDSGQCIGELLVVGDKRSKWFTKDATLALPENDHYSITRIKDFMEKGMKAIIDY